MANEITHLTDPEASTASGSNALGAFQLGVKAWLEACFGQEIASDKEERCHRFVEEALELAQACGCTKKDVLELVHYVFNRPAGEKEQEVGGTMVTLAGLCQASGMDMQSCADRELSLNWTKVEKIRAKQAAKPKNSPLPQYIAPGMTTADPETLYDAAKDVFRQNERVSYTLLQRHLKVGYNKAMDMIERMEDEGFVSFPDSNGIRTLIGRRAVEAE